MADLTVITPIAPHHALLFEECAASVQGQTAAVQHLYMMDTIGQGPAAVRNMLLEQANTPYVTFLDADDWLEPTFAARTLQAVHPARYVYTDWYQDGKVVESPACAWIYRRFHLVTAVVPTPWVRAVGGFDESLDGMEDTDFYMKLVMRGFCGKRLPEPLVHYRKDGGRARYIHQSKKAEALQAEMTRRYGGREVSCCGGGSMPEPTEPVGIKQDGDVLARALWAGNRKEHGKATGRHYPRMAFPGLTWVDPRDIRVSPHLWQAVPQVEQEPELPKA